MMRTLLVVVCLVPLLTGCFPTGSKIIDTETFEKRARGQEVTLLLEPDTTIVVQGFHFGADSLLWDGGGVPRSRLRVARTTMNRDWAALVVAFDGFILGTAVSAGVGELLASPENARHVEALSMIVVLPACTYLGWITGHYFAPDDWYVP